MKKQNVLQGILISCALVLLFIATQVTRFENELMVSFDGENLTAKTHLDVLTMSLPDAEFNNLSASFQKSARHENGLASLVILDEEGKPRYSDDRFVIYLLGKDILGTMVRGEYPNFWRSFGDWTMDRFRSKVMLYSSSLPERFTVYVSFIGRGYITFYLSDVQEIKINIADGDIDNAFSICTVKGCTVTETHESLFTNIKRISNFFFEGLFLASIIVIFVTVLFTRPVLSKIFGKLKLRLPGKTIIFIVFLMIIHFSLASYFGIKVLDAVPHIPDSAIYYQQGILLSEGKLFLSNFTREPVAAFSQLGGFARNGNIYFQYNHFWPALLAIFIKIGLPQFLNPLLSALSLLFVYLIAVKLYDKKTGIISALLYSISPFMIIMGGDFMMHAATQLFVLAGIYFLLSYVNDQKPSGALLGGLCFAYAFGLRQLTTLAIAGPVAAFLLLFNSKKIFKAKSVLFLVGFLFIFAFFLIDNQVITGNWLQSPHSTMHGIKASPSNIKTGSNWMESTLSLLPPILFYSYIPILLISLAFIPLLVLRKKEDYFLISIFIALLAAYMLVTVHGIHGYGPRFLFESAFVFFILISRGFLWIFSKSKGIFKAMALLAFILLIIHNMWGLYEVLPAYRNYNGLNSGLVKEIGKLDLANSIVIIPASFHWHPQGLTATFFDPSYEKSFFIKELPQDEHHKILVEHPERKVYRIGFDNVVPYEIQTKTAVNATTVSRT